MQYGSRNTSSSVLNGNSVEKLRKTEKVVKRANLTEDSNLIFPKDKIKFLT
jgi:hypothetical protein